MEGRDMQYSMVIQWEPQGRVYVVTVPELPGCVTHGNTYEEAARQGMDAIDTWVLWGKTRRRSRRLSSIS